MSFTRTILSVFPVY